MFLEPRTLLRTHVVGFFIWLGLLIPTLGWWKASIVYVVFQSWYANWVGHFSSIQAARTEVRQDEQWQRLERLLRLIWRELRAVHRDLRWIRHRLESSEPSTLE